MSEKKPEEPKPHRCVVDFWQRGIRADLREQRKLRCGRPVFVCPGIAVGYGYDGGFSTEGWVCGVVLVGDDGGISVWRGEAPQA